MARVTQGVTSAGAPQRVTGAEGAVSQQPGWWQQLMSPCPATRALSQPHTPFPALGDSRVGLGVPVLLRVTLQAGPVTASMGGLLHCPPWGKGFFVPSRPSMSP